MRLCLACKRWHDPLLDCKRAVRMGKSYETKPVESPESGSAQVGKGSVRAEKVEIRSGPCAACMEKDALIAALKVKIERYASRNALHAAVTPVTLTVTRSNADRQREYRERKRLAAKK